MNGINDLLGLGLEPGDLEFHQVCLRGIIVFCAALLMVRFANRRFMAKLSAFDVILGFILASMLSRAINGSAPFFPTLGTGVVLVFVHRLMSAVTYHSDAVGKILKGEPQVVVRDGVPDRRCLRKHNISDKDLLEEARLNGQVSALEKIQLAVMERNGHISIVVKE